MLKELYGLIGKLEYGILKLESLAAVKTGEIMTLVSLRQTHLNQYQSLRMEREYLRGQVYSYRQTIKSLKAIIAIEEA